MELTFNSRSQRVKEAKAARWFSGKKLWAWQGLLIADVVIGVWLWVAGWQFYGVFLAAGLGKLSLLIWYHWHLAELPTTKPDGRQTRLDQVTEGEILPALASAQTPQALWQALSPNWQLRFFINRFGLDSRAISDRLSSNSSDLPAVWSLSYDISQRTGAEAITAAHIATAMILSIPKIESYLARLKLSSQDLINGLLWIQRLKQTIKTAGRKQVYGGVGRDWSFGYTPLLNRFATNISRQVEAGAWHLNLEIHQPLVTQIINTLAQPSKNSVALVGPTGVGKTTLAYNLAEEMLGDRLNSPLKYDQIFSLNASVLIANAQDRGELEALVLNLLTEALKAKNIIIFLDDAQLFLSDETGSVDLSNVLLPVLQNSQVRLLMAITPSVWQKLVARNPDLASHINHLAVPIPDEAVTQAVLQDQSLLIESQTKTTITYQAIREAYRLAERYDSEQANPGKSIKLLLSAANYTQSGLVTAGAVAKAVESSLGIKVSEASAVEKDQLLNLEAALHKRMINQDYAVKVLSDALRRARAGVKTAKRPVGSFLFLGPTGVGKTQLAKALAHVYFGGAEKIIRVDMSEYANSGDEQRLLAAAADNAHSFLMQVRTKPFSVVLLDEVEKAHPQVLNLLLQMLDEGHLTDGTGRTVSFKDAIIIATSNAGADTIRAQIEEGHSLDEFSAEFIDSLINRKQFLPELINRFDEVVLFRPLELSELRSVVDLMIDEINLELAIQKVKVSLSDGAKDWLVSTGNDRRLGARPLRRMIQRTVENLVARRLLDGSLRAGGLVELTASDLEAALSDKAGV